MSGTDSIEIRNAHIHNLKGVDVRIPKHKLTVITGVSGSGKSSLAFDTLYEEGKRRYLMFSGTDFMIDSTPSFERITGLAPTVAVEQRTIRQSNPRSTVGTRLKLSAMLSALFANYGVRDPGYEDGIPLEVSMFQRNSPRGMCVKCLGKGITSILDEEALFADKSQRICEVSCGIGGRGKWKHVLGDFCERHGMNLWQDTIGELTEEQILLLKYGDGGKSEFQGFVPLIYMSVNGAFSTSGRLAHQLRQLGMMVTGECRKCGGSGLGQQAAHTRFDGKLISELEDMYISELLSFFRGQDVKNVLVEEIIAKLDSLVRVGIGHLSLSRPVPTLSGGEIQRLFLAGYLQTEMDSLIFVFDEPTIGLHEAEKEKLIRAVRALVDGGNTVIAVEHDANFMREADYIIDLGPGAGIKGGWKIYEGGYEEFLQCADSRTSPYLTRERGFPVKAEYRPIREQNMLIVTGACLHNLKNVTARIPLGVMTGVAGVSGSGKSSLIADTLVPMLREQMKTGFVSEEEEEEKSQVTASLSGAEKLKKCYVIDQRPIGRSRTSSPATYTGIFDRVRTLFANTGTARERGWGAGMFSVNSTGGCPKCKGDGMIHYHVGFGNMIDIPCDSCGGSGYIPEVMEIELEGRNIRDILEMSIDEAEEFFRDKDKVIHKMLRILQRVGLGYIKLGQANPTISGGESQRIKLARELERGKNAKGALYILDEPTTGLSFSDSELLMKLLNELVDQGNSIIVTEHDPYILSNCDYILEMGPGGGSEGGMVIAGGTPAELRENENSVIGKYLLKPWPV